MLGASVVAASACTRAAPPEAVRREPGLSVLLITIDTLRADALGTYGNRRAQTPWMDRLASAGVRFDAAHAHNVVTLPSHANILSGRYPFDHGVRDNAGFRLAPDVDTLATLLEARGYRTGAFVSAFPLDSRFGLDRGFAVYDDDFVGVRAQRAFLEPERAGAETVARARKWLDAQAGAPSFTWVHLYEPHFPYGPQGATAPQPRDAAYAAEVTAVDAALAPLLDPILGAGAAGRTLVVLTADHGEALGDHGEATHGIFAYESTLRVPLIVYQPRLWRAATIGVNVRHVDILPTVLDAIAAPVPGNLAGRSLLPVIAGEKVDEAPTYFEALSASLNRGWAPLTGVIEGTVKFIELPEPELYALDVDPGESKNLVFGPPGEFRDLRPLLATITAGDRPVSPGGETAETRERLRSLGYLTAAPRTERRFGERDDPKRLMALDRQLQDVTARYLAGDLRGALERCRDLVRQRPTMTVSLLYLAQLERDAGHLDAGISALRRALEQQPGSTEALGLLGAYLGEAGRHSEAVALLEPRVRGGDADSQVVSAYAVALARVGRTREALAVLAAARGRDPSSASLLVETGTVALIGGDRAAARAAFHAAVDRNPDVARAHTSLGILALEDNRVDEAFVHWQHAVRADPRELNTLAGMAAAQQRAGRQALARPILTFLDRYRR